MESHDRFQSAFRHWSNFTVTKILLAAMGDQSKGARLEPGQVKGSYTGEWKCSVGMWTGEQTGGQQRPAGTIPG